MIHYMYIYQYIVRLVLIILMYSLYHKSKLKNFIIPPYFAVKAFVLKQKFKTEMMLEISLPTRCYFHVDNVVSATENRICPSTNVVTPPNVPRDAFPNPNVVSILLCE